MCSSRRTFIKRSASVTAALTIPLLSQGKATNNDAPEQNLPNGATGPLTLSIDFDFENGNLGRHRIDGNTIIVGPVSRHKDTWFSFRIKGVKHKTITMIIEWLNTAPVSSNFGGQGNNTAMITYDGLGYEIVKDANFVLKDPANNAGNFVQTIRHTFRENEAHIAYCAPWSNTRMARLADKLKSDTRVVTDNIGYSKFRNLPITYFRITDPNVPDGDKKKFFLIAREDSYEAGSSWAVEGLMNFILSDDPVAKQMRKKMVFVIFPIFSVDGVAMGATNFPLQPDNSEFVYVTAQWEHEPAYHEVRLMKDFWDKLKSEGFNPNVSFKLHATCYWQCHFRPEDCAPENLQEERELLDVLRRNLSWRIEDPPLKRANTYMNHHFLKVFPAAITYSSHNDFIFTKGYLKTDQHVYRRHEDVLQDGELIARSFAEFYDIPSEAVAPYLMGGDVDRNCGEKGTPLVYSVYYYDLHHMPAEKVEVVINKKAYEMTAEPDADYSKPVRFTFTTILKDTKSEYRFRASNGKKSRTIPETDYALPGPFIVKNR